MAQLVLSAEARKCPSAAFDNSRFYRIGAALFNMYNQMLVLEWTELKATMILVIP